jgi:hypothetical protein
MAIFGGGTPDNAATRQQAADSTVAAWFNPRCKFQLEERTSTRPFFL